MNNDDCAWVRSASIVDGGLEASYGPGSIIERDDIGVAGWVFNEGGVWDCIQRRTGALATKSGHGGKQSDAKANGHERDPCRYQHYWRFALTPLACTVG